MYDVAIVRVYNIHINVKYLIEYFCDVSLFSTRSQDVCVNDLFTIKFLCSFPYVAT